MIAAVIGSAPIAMPPTASGSSSPSSSSMPSAIRLRPGRVERDLAAVEVVAGFLPEASVKSPSARASWRTRSIRAVCRTWYKRRQRRGGFEAQRRKLASWIDGAIGSAACRLLDRQQVAAGCLWPKSAPEFIV